MSEITELVQAYRRGDSAALDDLIAQIYPELRRVARSQLRRLRFGQTLDTTALVNEAYIKLAHSSGLEVTDRSHFLAIVARAMRMILVDHARARSAQKRGGEEAPITLDVNRVAAKQSACDVVDLERAMEGLTELDPRLCRIVECRFYAGMTVEETAAALDVSQRTVLRDWKRARAWLIKDLADHRKPAV